MSDKELFFGGVPVGPDVDALDMAFPDLKHDQILTHDEVSSVVDYPWRSSRYRTVLSAWRKRLFEERQIELQAIRSVGLKVMTNTERVECHIGKAASGIKTIVKAGERIAAVPRKGLSSDATKRAEHAQMYISRMGFDFSKFKRELPAQKPAQPVYHFLKSLREETTADDGGEAAEGARH